MSTVKIKNHSNQPISIPAKASGGVGFVLVPENVTIEGADLPPGVTRVDADKWKAVEKIPAVQRRLAGQNGARAELEVLNK